jgi:hypothetical protein
MKANLLDDGVGDTLVLPAFDDVTFISHGKRVNLRARIKKLNRPAYFAASSQRRPTRHGPSLAGVYGDKGASPFRA